MKWLLDNKFPYEVYTFSSAAENGNLENMKWLFEHNFPYDTSTFSCAAENGHLEILKWLQSAPREEDRCPLDKTAVCFRAAKNGHLEILKWARENDCGWTADAYIIADRSNYTEILKYLEENNCPKN